MEVEIAAAENAVFRSVSGLQNLTFDAENIVTGRGATEDQLKVVYDRYAALKQIVDDQAENPQDVVVQDISARLDSLETLIDEGCESFSQAELQVLQEIDARLEAMELEIDACCDRGVLAGGDLSGDLSGGTDNGADVAVFISWAADPLTDGGQMAAVSAGGEQIVEYWFLVQKAAGIYTRMRIARYAGKILTLDPDTGAIAVSDAPVGTTIPTTAKLFIGATDGADCEGIATVLAASAPWYAPGN